MLPTLDTVAWGEVFLYPLMVEELPCNHCKQILERGDPTVIDKNTLPEKDWWLFLPSEVYCDPICKEVEKDNK